MTVCPNCGEENPERFRFCGVCGFSLVAEGDAPEEERKVVSVLFVDLVGFTARSETADPEDVRARLRPYHGRVREEIERFGGTVEKFVGDAVMAVFGAPVSHEDDPERAVRAALRVLDAIDDLNELQPDLDFAVRAAVNTGEALVTLAARAERGEAVVAGDVVNTAARLQTSAPVGALVVGETTYRSTRDTIEYEPLDPVAVKGKAEPIPRWRAVGARARLGVDLEPGSSVPLVGREAELEVLRGTYERVVAESSVQLVTIVGEPGIGKSRLLREFRAVVDSRPELVRWRQGRCLPYGEGIAFWALGEVVKAEAGILDSDSSADAAKKLATAVAGVADASERDWLVARLAPLVGARSDDPAAQRTETFTAWRRFLESLAADRPLIVVVEDLHWADPALVEFMEELVEWGTAVPVLVLCTARPELYERHAGWGGGKRNSTTLGLTPLNAEQTAHLLAALFDRAVLPAETQALLLERTGGNPLYAEEFVRMLGDRGLLSGTSGTGTLEVEVPQTLGALISARLDTLSAERKSLLHDAAVVGKVFWTGAVATIGDRARAEVSAGLRELVRKELVRPVRASSVGGEEEFSFWHGLVRDVAYGQIPRSARARRHRRAAEWIESTAGDRVGDHAEVLAHHYLEAVRLARASGADAEAAEVVPAARRFLALAAERLRRVDVRQAVVAYERALELTPEADDDRAAIVGGLAESLTESGRQVDSFPYFEEALRLYRARGNNRAAGEAALTYSATLRYTGRAERREAVSREAIALLEAEGAPDDLALAYGWRAGDAMLSGETAECLEWAERALAVEGVEPWRRIRPLQSRGHARCELGDLHGLDDLRDGLRIALEVGLANAAGLSYINLGGWIWQIHGPAAGLANHREGMAFSRARGIGQVGWLRAESLWMLYDLGDWDELLAESAISLQAVREAPNHHMELMASAYRGLVVLHRGELEEAAALAEASLAPARRAGDPQVLVPVLACAALVAYRAGRVADSLALVEELRRETADKAIWHRARFLPDAVRVSHGAARGDLAVRLRETVREAYTPRDRNLLLAADAAIAEHAGELARALALHDEAAAAWGRYGHMLERGHALLGAGRCLLGLGRASRADARLRSAREVFIMLGARPLLAEADDLLGRTLAETS